LGDLKGNHFSIVLRNLSTTAESVVQASLREVSTHGFVNYFGLQRFGTSQVGTYEVGKALLLGQWENAVRLILKPADDGV
jgi:tRNA pseudouridine13 synthase